MEGQSIGAEPNTLGVREGVCRGWGWMTLGVTFRNEENPSPYLVPSCVLLREQQLHAWEGCGRDSILRSRQV